MNHMTHTGSVRCPECGAPSINGMTCWEQLGLLLAWEYDDPALQAEHFLTVAAYNLQHPAPFTDEAIAGLQTVFIDYLDNGLPLAHIRQRVGRASAGNKRVLKGASKRHPLFRAWSMTIGDVYVPDMPQGAATRVRAWAASIRNEL
jgi:hypothetical protein